MFSRFFIFAVLCFFYFSSQAQDENDFYIWNKISLNIELNESNSLKITTKSHFLTGDGVRDLSYLDVSFAHEVNNWLDLAIAVRGAQIKLADNELMEYRPLFLSTITLLDRALTIKSTNRIEYRFFDEKEGHARYCHKMFFHLPQILEKIPQAYVGEELFAKLNGVGLHMTRLYGGMHLLDNGWLSLDLYYTWQQVSAGEIWNDTDIVGMNMTFSI